jgi:hypothetical protein
MSFHRVIPGHREAANRKSISAKGQEAPLAVAMDSGSRALASATGMTE